MVATTVTHILDIDGFYVDKGGSFLYREMACVEIATNICYRTIFSLGRSYDSLSTQDQQQVNYVTRNIHGMLFDSDSSMDVPQADAGTVLRQMLKKSYTRNRDTVVGYKGGNVEYSLLGQLGIRSLNLETIGCPKYNDLLVSTSKGEREIFGFDRLDCGLHNHATRGVIAHCPMSEVRCFRFWYLTRYLLMM